MLKNQMCRQLFYSTVQITEHVYHHRKFHWTVLSPHCYSCPPFSWQHQCAAFSCHIHLLVPFHPATQSQQMLACLYLVVTISSFDKFHNVLGYCLARKHGILAILSFASVEFYLCFVILLLFLSAFSIHFISGWIIVQSCRRHFKQQLSSPCAVPTMPLIQRSSNTQKWRLLPWWQWLKCAIYDKTHPKFRAF